jgi:hypothetical protein
LDPTVPEDRSVIFPCFDEEKQHANTLPIADRTPSPLLIRRGICLILGTSVYRLSKRGRRRRRRRRRRRKVFF